MANWPLLLIQIAEAVLMVMIIVIGVIAIGVPVGVIASNSHVKIDDSTPQAFVRSILLEHTFILAYVVIAATVILIVAMALHSFVKAGVTGIYLDGERGAPAGAARSQFSRFSPERWFAYARSFWWQIFLIYNVVWGIFGIILIIPLIVLSALVFTMGNSEQALLVACAGLVILLGLLILAGVFFHLWSELAIAACLRDNGALRDSMSVGMRIFATRLADIALTVLVFFGVMIAASVCVLPFSFATGALSSVPGLALLTLPLQVFLSLLQNAISIVASSWFLAAIIGIVVKAGESRVA